jgi:arabinogalactan endo-1,4-beta-galactosidase
MIVAMLIFASVNIKSLMDYTTVAHRNEHVFLIVRDVISGVSGPPTSHRLGRFYWPRIANTANCELIQP